MGRWVAYSDDMTSIGTEPRGRIHYLDAEKNAFPCGSTTAIREWDDDTAQSAIDRGVATLCQACHYAREAGGMMGTKPSVASDDHFSTGTDALSTSPGPGDVAAISEHPIGSDDEQLDEFPVPVEEEPSRRNRLGGR